MSIVLTLVATVVASIACWYLSTKPAVTKKALQHIPECRFEDDDTPERYRLNSRSLLYKGYEKYSRHGIPFQMRNPIGELGPQLVLPMKYLDEVKYASTSLFSFPLFSEKAFLLSYSDAPRQTDAAAHVVRVDLTRNLGALANDMYREAIVGIEEYLSASKDCSSVPAYDFLSNITARVTALGLVGPELCRNEEWIQISLQTTFAIFNTAFSIRADYTPRWRWLARWRSDAPKQMRAMRARAVELLKPFYQDRAAALNQSSAASAFNDCIYWLLKNKNGSGGMSLNCIANEQLFLTVASMHTTSSTLVALLYDLLTHPTYLDEIIDEIERTRAECQDNWTLQEVSKMRRLDSFMKESQRVHPIGFITAQRVAVKAHTFKDGFHLPAGVIFQFPADAVHHDPEIYPNPDEFDGYRFLRLRETVDSNRFHFASVSDTMLGFGAGTHACPGRFFTALAVKLIVAVLLTRYEVTLTENPGVRPANGYNDFNMGPSREAKITLRRRSE
ncbi:cytochrome P450 [Aspergillus floccosus]